MKITNIEVVDHVYAKNEAWDYYVVRYASGFVKSYEEYDKLPETVKAFLKCHYDEYYETKYREFYKYKAINIIK